MVVNITIPAVPQWISDPEEYCDSFLIYCLVRNRHIPTEGYSELLENQIRPSVLMFFTPFQHMNTAWVNAGRYIVHLLKYENYLQLRSASTFLQSPNWFQSRSNKQVEWMFWKLIGWWYQQKAKTCDQICVGRYFGTVENVFLCRHKNKL